MSLKEGFLRRVTWYWVGPAIQTIVGIGMLPLTTLKLDPADFGFFALVTAAAAVMSAFAGLGGGYVLTAHFQARSAEARLRLNSSILAVQMVASVALACVLFILLPRITGEVMDPQLGVGTLFALVAFGVVLTTSWGLAQEVLVLEGRASTFTLLSLAGTIVAATGTLVALFVFDLDVSALFVGDFLSKLVLFVLGFVALRRQLAAQLESAILIEVLKIAPFSATASAGQHFSQLVYRYLLNVHASIAQVGLFVHAQSYERYGLTSIKAISRGVWPVNLSEAREAGHPMMRTQAASRATHLLIVMGGFTLALFGRELIGVLTHGKFVEAAPYAALLFIVLMTKYTGRADLARLYINSRGRTISNLSLLSDVSGMILGVLLIPHLAILGAVIALLGRELIYRLGMVAVTMSVRRMWLHDRWAAFGSLIILTSVILVEFFSISLLGKGALFIGAICLIGVAIWLNTRIYLLPRLKGLFDGLRKFGTGQVL
jgi:O-antigen/teichoic acid export membrane protein